jgi:hypothetical protein
LRVCAIVDAINEIDDIYILDLRGDLLNLPRAPARLQRGSGLEQRGLRTAGGDR